MQYLTAQQGLCKNGYVGSSVAGNQGANMRWDALFADLQAEAAAMRQDDFEHGVAEVIALEWSRVLLADRLRAHRGQELDIKLRGGETLTLEMTAAGTDWVSGLARGCQWLIPGAAMQMISGLTRRAEVERSQVRRRLTITSPLRALADAGAQVAVHGEAGILVQGRLLGAGRDFLDVRAHAQVPLSTVPLSVITAVRSVRS